MDLSSLAAIESYASELARSAKNLADYCQTVSGADRQSSGGLPSVPADAPGHIQRAIDRILTGTSKLRSLVGEPQHFLQELAKQNQLLACLRWLAEFQVLACIPLQGSVPSKDVAELTGVPVSVLMRIVRMTSTACFLCEPEPQHVAHTALSAEFVTKPLYADAASFIAGEATRAALHMASATHKYGEPGRPEQSAYSLSMSEHAEVLQSFPGACEHNPRLQRQWMAYCRSCSDSEEYLAEGLSLLDWGRQKSVCIIESNATPSRVVRRMAERHNQLSITVQQLCEPSLFEVVPLSPSSLAAAAQPISESVPGLLYPPRINVQRRTVGQPQTVPKADVYIIHLGSPSITPSRSLACLAVNLTAELRAHFPILRDSGGAATLVVAMRMLPDPGSLDSGVEAVARMHDLILLQLVNERDFEVSELVKLVHGVGDQSGRLVVVNRARSRNNAVMALGIKFHAATG